MSTLLINEHPLMVLPELAKAIGLNEAIILQQLHYWLGKSQNVEDGHRWVYNSYPEWQRQFPFWGLNTIKRTIYRLEESGLIVSGTYNSMKMDKTKWYRIDYDKLVDLELTTTSLSQNDTNIDPKWADQELNMDRPIPETTTRDYSNEVNNYRKRLDSESKDEEVVVTQPFQAKAHYVIGKLQTPANMRSSVLKMCKQHSEADIDQALSYAVDASGNKTLVFFKRLHKLGVPSS